MESSEVFTAMQPHFEGQDAITEEIGRIKGPFLGALWIDPVWALSANAMESFCQEEILVVSGNSSIFQCSCSSCLGVEMLRLVPT